MHDSRLSTQPQTAESGQGRPKKKVRRRTCLFTSPQNGYEETWWSDLVVVVAARRTRESKQKHEYTQPYAKLDASGQEALHKYTNRRHHHRKRRLVGWLRP